MKKPLIILTGPTAVGKSDLSIALAHAVNGSVISADSMQVYRHMDIGSAKISKDEMNGIPHYLIDIVNPEDEWNVVRFQEEAKKAMEEIYAQGRIPIVVGGTGFYIQALLYDIDFTAEEEDKAYREALETFAKEHGNHALHEKLAAVDPKAAEQIHENNVKRVIRALEFFEKSGNRISEHNEAERQKESPYNAAYFVLTDERQHLYDRIELRVDLMMKQGLLDEVKKLQEMGYHRDMVSMQGLGYKEVLDYLDSKCSLDEAVYVIKRDTRHFAKRQLTWFRREKEVLWLDKKEFNYDDQALLEYILKTCRERQIIGNEDRNE